MLVCGIDPGKDGAVAVLDTRDRGVVFLGTTPTVRIGKTKRDYNVGGMRNILSSLEIKMCFIEKQQAFPGQGRSSALNLGMGFGLWLGLLGGLKIPHDVISPRSWTSEILRDSPGEGKARNIKAAMMLFPDQTLLASERSRKPHDGLADALLIAEYCARRMRS